MPEITENATTPPESADYEPALIANYFISMGVIQNKNVTPMKLLKLVYIAYAWYYTVFGKTLFRERPEAWKYGPVIPSIYHEFKRFGSSRIIDLATVYQDGQVITPLLSEDDPSAWQSCQITSFSMERI